MIDKLREDMDAIKGIKSKQVIDADGVKIPVETDYLKKSWYSQHLQQKGRVSLSLLKGQSGDYYINVEVYSVVKMGVIKCQKVPVKLENLKYMIMVSASLCAEQLCNDFGDRIDPDQVAHKAEEAFMELRSHPKAKQVFTN